MPYKCKQGHVTSMLDLCARCFVDGPNYKNLPISTLKGLPIHNDLFGYNDFYAMVDQLGPPLHMGSTNHQQTNLVQVAPTLVTFNQIVENATFSFKHLYYFTILTTKLLKSPMKNMELIILERLKIVEGKATCNNKSQLRIITPIFKLLPRIV